MLIRGRGQPRPQVRILHSPLERRREKNMPMATKEAQRKYQRQWMARRRSEFFSDKTCVVCGGSENLELDHINRSDKVDHKIWSWSKERQATEIAKCQVLCGKCHQVKTSLENSKPLIHGTNAGYTRKCRCTNCKDAHATAAPARTRA